jgi:hypothetical protein
MAVALKNEPRHIDRRCLEAKTSISKNSPYQSLTCCADPIMFDSPRQAPSSVGVKQKRRRVLHLHELPNLLLPLPSLRVVLLVFSTRSRNNIAGSTDNEDAKDPHDVPSSSSEDERLVQKKGMMGGDLDEIIKDLDEFTLWAAAPSILPDCATSIAREPCISTSIARRR